MKKVNFFDCMDEIIPELNSGAFLVSGETGNPMTVGWASFGIVWGKPICTVFVRHSRFSHTLMEENTVFTLCVPGTGEMKTELAFCGRRSGRDTDKLSETGLSVLELENGGKALSQCKYHLVCKTVAKTEMDMGNVSPEILERYYNTNQVGENGDPHTIYFAEILDTFVAR